MTNYNKRFSGIFDLSSTRATIIGLGGIGAITAITLTKMGLNLIVVDYDRVSIPNVGTQFYPSYYEGHRKAKATQSMCKNHAPNSLIDYRDFEVTKNTKVEDIYSPIIISAVDTLAARKVIWPLVIESKATFIDARMGAELFTMYTVLPNNYIQYENLLFSISDNDIPPIPCTSKATIYTALFAASWIATTIRLITSGEPAPFMLSHNIMSMDVKVMQ